MITCRYGFRLLVERRRLTAGGVGNGNYEEGTRNGSGLESGLWE